MIDRKDIERVLASIVNGVTDDIVGDGRIGDETFNVGVDALQRLFSDARKG